MKNVSSFARRRFCVKCNPPKKVFRKIQKVPHKKTPAWYGAAFFFPKLQAPGPKEKVEGAQGPKVEPVAVGALGGWFWVALFLVVSSMGNQREITSFTVSFLPDPNPRKLRWFLDLLTPCFNQTRLGWILARPKSCVLWMRKTR